MEIIAGIVVGMAVAGVAAVVMVRGRRSTSEAVGRETRRALEAMAAQHAAALEALAKQNSSSMEAQQRLSGEMLDGKKALIDQQLEKMNARLEDVGALMHALESDRQRKFGELSEALSLQNDGLHSLLQTTQSLREALSSTKARGQWGERMAEDVLRLAGFVENVNYRKQKALEGARGIPDYTFMLPNDLLLHMDVKFPLQNYLRYCEAGSDLERKRYRDDFLKDVRARVKELSARDYTDPSGGTVDFVLLFIPNEELYAFMHSQDHALLDDALQQQVVFCSPLTLFVVLALIRQMVENFRLARTSDEILALLGEFTDQWAKFKTQMGKVGARIDSAQREYEALVGTRTRVLERPLLKINELRGHQLELIDDELEPPFALEA
jgi:DNA recombination protein RmuC